MKKIHFPDIPELIMGLSTCITGILLLIVRGNPDVPIIRYPLAIFFFAVTIIFWFI